MQALQAMRVILTLMVCLYTTCECVKIVAVLPCSSRSHHLWNVPLLEALADRGHQVVALTPFAEPDRPNLRYVLLKDESNISTKMKPSLLHRTNFTSAYQHIDAFFQCCFDLCRNLLTSTGTKQIMELKGSVDLLIMESFGYECLFGLMYHFGVPTVAVSAHGHTPWNSKQMGIPQQVAVLPLEMYAYDNRMSFWQRVSNTALYVYMQVRRCLEYLPRHEATARTVFGPDMPSFAEIEQNFSMFLVNAVPGLDPPRPLPPNVINVGCLHCRPGRPLSPDLQSFLDGADQGAIYFSLGSNVPTEQLPAASLAALIEAFAALPQRVLWKWDGNVDTLPLRPSNVLFSHWLPQQDVLAHPNMRVFVTHSGRLSTQEALFHGVPILAIPVFGDQFLNGHRAQELGWALHISINNITKAGLLDALQQLVNDPRFRENAQHWSRISRDQPSSPVERAVFWVEHAARHKGTPHLRPAALDLSWLQLHLIDVAFVIVALPLVLTFMIFKLTRSLRGKRKK